MERGDTPRVLKAGHLLTVYEPSVPQTYHFHQTHVYIEIMVQLAFDVSFELSLGAELPCKRVWPSEHDWWVTTLNNTLNFKWHIINDKILKFYIAFTWRNTRISWSFLLTTNM